MAGISNAVRYVTDWAALLSSVVHLLDFMRYLFTCSDAFRDRKEHGSGLRLARELVDLEAKTGKAYRKREELHRQAEANRAFAHFLR